jgi:hypothetical protein
MNNITKVTLSSGELAIARDTNFILTKRIVIKKVEALFNILLSNINETFEGTFAKEEIIKTTPPKLSKGENYKGLPYVILDYPSHFSKENSIAVRTMFWWGNFFSITLHLTGKSKSWLIESIPPEKIDDAFYVCINNEEWEHHFEADNYILLSTISTEQLTKLKEKNFVKIALKYELHHWNMMQLFLAEGYKKINSLLNYQLPIL